MWPCKLSGSHSSTYTAGREELWTWILSWKANPTLLPKLPSHTNLLLKPTKTPAFWHTHPRGIVWQVHRISSLQAFPSVPAVVRCLEFSCGNFLPSQVHVFSSYFVMELVSGFVHLAHFKKNSTFKIYLTQHITGELQAEALTPIEKKKKGLIWL